MVPDSRSPVAVVGATGRQGGAVARALLGRGAPVRAVVRDPDKAGDLVALGAGVAVADLDDTDALRAAFDGATAVFAMTTMTGPDGTEGEVANGRSIADAALAARVPHLLYSSVGGADRGTGIPHFESKWRVEEYLREIGVPTVVIRPAFFMENFLDPFAPRATDGEVVLAAPLRPGVPLQMIAVEDIGAAAATGLLDPAAVPGGAVEIGTVELTPEAIAEAFGAASGLPGRLDPTPIGEVEDDDARAMFEWIAEPPAYAADFERTRALAGELTDFAAFAAGHPVGEG